MTSLEALPGLPLPWERTTQTEQERIPQGPQGTKTAQAEATETEQILSCRSMWVMCDELHELNIIQLGRSN